MYTCRWNDQTIGDAEYTYRRVYIDRFVQLLLVTSKPVSQHAGGTWLWINFTSQTCRSPLHIRVPVEFHYSIFSIPPPPSHYHSIISRKNIPSTTKISKRTFLLPFSSIRNRRFDRVIRLFYFFFSFLFLPEGKMGGKIAIYKRKLQQSIRRELGKLTRRFRFSGNFL